jgi:DNA-binding XRE family transcriptional regulator
MNATVQNFKALMEAALPNGRISIDPPAQPSGHWFIDIQSGRKSLTVEYRPRKGFGIIRATAQFGEASSETYRTAELAARRATQLLTAPKPNQPFTLKNLRELYDCTQVDLAQKLGIKQSAISRFEQRNEVKLGTLSAAIKALGGQLEIRAHFPDADIPIALKE